MFFFDPLYLLLVVPPILFMVYAQIRVTTTYNKYSKVANSQRLSGAQAAQVLLRANNLYNGGSRGSSRETHGPL